jgi:hypothetical protein
MSPVEERVALALRARAQEADMSQPTMQRNHLELLSLVAAGRRSRRRAIAAAAAAVVLVALVAVGLAAALGGGQERAVPAGPDAGERRAAQLLGAGFEEFTRTITPADQAAVGAQDVTGGGWPTGEARLDLVDGQVKVLYAAGPKAFLVAEVTRHGRWRVGPLDERGYCQQTGTYRAVARGEQITLTALTDPCPDREAALTGTWTR